MLPQTYAQQETKGAVENRSVIELSNLSLGRANELYGRLARIRQSISPMPRGESGSNAKEDRQPALQEVQSRTCAALVQALEVVTELEQVLGTQPTENDRVQVLPASKRGLHPA